MSICLLCYAFPFYVSAITLARSELSLPICLVLMYPFFHPLCAPSYLLFFLPLFRCLLCPHVIGFSHPGSLSACNGSPNCLCASFSLILLGQAFCEKFHFPTICLISFVLTFFFFFFLQAAKLNDSLRELLCFLCLDRLYNTCFVRLSVESCILCMTGVELGLTSFLSTAGPEMSDK